MSPCSHHVATSTCFCTVRAVTVGSGRRVTLALTSPLGVAASSGPRRSGWRPQVATLRAAARSRAQAPETANPARCPGLANDGRGSCIPRLSSALLTSTACHFMHAGPSLPPHFNGATRLADHAEPAWPFCRSGCRAGVPLSLNTDLATAPRAQRLPVMSPRARSTARPPP